MLLAAAGLGVLVFVRFKSEPLTTVVVTISLSFAVFTSTSLVTVAVEVNTADVATIGACKVILISTDVLPGKVAKLHCTLSDGSPVLGFVPVYIQFTLSTETKLNPASTLTFNSAFVAATGTLF